jgi:hypothetical protein
MNIYAYWFGNFIYDYLLYLILAVFSVLMCQALSVDAFTGTSYGATWIVFLLYGLAYIPFTYIAAYIFIDYGNALAGFYFFTFVIGGLLSTIIMVLRFLGTTTGSIAKGVSWILRLIPSYSFG